MAARGGMSPSALPQKIVLFVLVRATGAASDQRTSGKRACFHASIPPDTLKSLWKPWRWSIAAATALRWPLPQMTALG
jgi:hypothetical protein